MSSRTRPAACNLPPSRLYQLYKCIILPRDKHQYTTRAANSKAGENKGRRSTEIDKKRMNKWEPQM